MKKFLLVFALLLMSTRAVQAQEETTNSAELRRAIRERIEQTLQNDTESESPYVGIIGALQKVGTATFTMTTPSGEEKTIQIMADTPLLLNGKTVPLADMVIGSGVAVIGEPLDELVIEARRVILRNEPFDEVRRVDLGTITKVDARSLTLTVRGRNTEESFVVDRQTKYEDNQAQALTARDIEVDQAALVISDVTTNGQRHAKVVRLVVPVER